MGRVISKVCVPGSPCLVLHHSHPQHLPHPTPTTHEPELSRASMLHGGGNQSSGEPSHISAFFTSVVSADSSADEGPPGGLRAADHRAEASLRLPGPMVYSPGNLLVGLILI